MHKYTLRRIGLSDTSGYHQPNLQDCLEAVLEQSDPLMDGVLVGLKVGLVTVPGKAAIVVHPGARDVIEHLNSDPKPVKQAFAMHLRKAVFSGAGVAPGSQQAMHFDDFQFLDANQLDANIEAAHCQQIVTMAVEEVLPKVNAMVSHLMGWSSIQGHLNPLRPESFTTALRSALEDLVPDRSVRTPLVHAASGLLGVSLNQLYREISDWLRSMGVEPVHMTSTKVTGVWNPTKAPESTVARTMLTLDKLRRLLSGELNTRPLPMDRIDFSSTIPASLEALQDMRLVEPMMKRLSERASSAQVNTTQKPAATVVDMLAESDAPADRKKLGEQLGREVVVLILENLMKDRRLLPQVRASLQALEPVLVTLSQHDGRFFSERHHPARAFLDRMTHRSLAFATESSPGYEVFQKNFDNAVRALTSGSGEAASFARILEKLESAWSSEEAGHQKRAAEAARGLMRAEQRNLLAQRVRKQFSERLRDIQVPPLVGAFLLGPWAQVVAEAQLNFADGSVDPGGYVALLDDLLWSVQLRLVRNNRQRLINMVPGILVTIRKGFELISYPQQRMESFFNALVAFYEQAFDGSHDAPTKPLQSAGAAEPDGSTDSFWVVEHEAAESGFMEAGEWDELPQNESSNPADRRAWEVDSLATGAWVDLSVDGESVRAQLTWASPQRRLFLFISSAGAAHSMTRQTLEKLKKAGRIRLVSGARVMDKALDAVAQTALDNELRAKVAKDAN